MTEQLLIVRESAVKATPLFLSNSEIENIKQYVPQALKDIPRLIVLEKEDRPPTAFTGIDGQKLEMLFVAASERGKGLGKVLLRYGIDKYSVGELTANEQNPLAKGFYEHMGFRVFQQSNTDRQGNPYPILYMKRR